jgi:hypothetical protein
MWSVRFDCRDSRLESEVKHLESMLAEEGSVRVDVGKWGVDHKDASLAFVDDDAPCTVRVVGPGADQRLAIARLIAPRLTSKTAPMRPRPAPLAGAPAAN